MWTCKQCMKPNEEPSGACTTCGASKGFTPPTMEEVVRKAEKDKCRPPDALITALQVCLGLTGIVLLLCKITNPSPASLLSPILCFVAAARVSKQKTRVSFIALMILPVITAVANMTSPPTFQFEYQCGIAGLVLLGASIVLWLCCLYCETPNLVENSPPPPAQTTPK